MPTREPPSTEQRRPATRRGLPRLASRYRNPISVAVHAFLIALSLFAAFGLAYNFHGIVTWFRALYLPLLCVALPIKLIVFARTRLFRSSWRYVGLRDLFSIAVASQISSFFFIIVYFLIENGWKRMTGALFFAEGMGFPQSIFLIDWAATIALVSAARVIVRSYYEFTRGTRTTLATRILIVGANDHGENLLREILRKPELGYDVVGIVDDSVTKLGHRIHGVEVIGQTPQLPEICADYQVDELLIAMPEATPRELRKVIDLCEGNSLRFRAVPAMAALIEGRVQVSQLRSVDIEDLLGREPVTLDVAAIGAYLSDKCIVVTGAGGSIGAEMCRQIARFHPRRIILLEQAENSLFQVHRDLLASHPELDIVPVVADICDAARMRQVFTAHAPSVVFHAAAHKHVPMMEWNPGEAIKNNVVGTRTVAEAAAATGVEKMVMISTDKAVNPTSVMGCTKRVAEMFVQQFGKHCTVQFVTVRFGNVLGSSGSVIPIFKEQIAKGGPVTVTHPDMTRYFMTIPEASQLVLQAGAMGRGGEIYVLDMGDPIKIIELAHNMITLSGLRVDDDIEIVYTGTRPGEKLFEELLIDGEHVSATSHPKIGIWKSRREDWEGLLQKLDLLIAAADSATPDEIRELLGGIVPEYQPATAGAAPLAPVAPAPEVASDAHAPCPIRIAPAAQPEL